ncbi:winged helix-turn-helix domain-containing protein [Dokdonella sp.]|uniref:winged helix-turn-helix domain-containing protein n=1 Tax=Dokdonella sp. TaxID=2291710 RepID=UPI002F422A79
MLAVARLRYRTGNTLIDLDAREIRRDGVPVEVEAKVFDLIALLLRERGRALDKRELNAELWGDRPVTDAALSQQLRKARRALGDDGDAQRVIRTVHGRGLRWVGDVVELPDDPPAASPPPEAPAAALPHRVHRLHRRLVAAAALFALAVALAGTLAYRSALRPGGDEGPAGTRIAILPLEDDSGDDGLGWTRAGLMGLMASLFAEDGRVDVVAAKDVLASDVSTRASDAGGAAAVRAAFGATHLVATRLRRVGPLYELEVRLVAAGSADRSETLHGSAPAPLAVDAVTQVRRWLDLAPLPDVRSKGIASAFLAEAYARGLDAQLHGDTAGARKYFEICLDQDPGLAWPRLGLAIAQGAAGDAQASEANAAKVAAAAREAGDEELLVAAERQLGSLAFRRGDLDGAARHLQAALADVAENRPFVLTDLLVAQASVEDERGHFDLARTLFERALALARTTGSRRGEALVLVNFAAIDNGAGDAAAAAAKLRQGLDAARAAGDATLEGNTLANLGAAEANQGRLLDAATLLQQARALARRRGDVQLGVLASLQLLGVLAPFDRGADVDRLARQIGDAAERQRNPYWRAELAWALGLRAARRGDYADALRHYEEARAVYAEAGIARSLAPILADIVDAAAAGGDAPAAHAAADAFRAIARADARAWAAWLPLLDAQLRHVDGDAAGALDDLADRLDRAPGAIGPAAQASLFQLGRWQLASGRSDDILLREAWKPWLEQHPQAIALRIAALRAAHRTAEADVEQARLERLRHAPQLDVDDLVSLAP